MSVSAGGVCVCVENARSSEFKLCPPHFIACSVCLRPPRVRAQRSPLCLEPQVAGTWPLGRGGPAQRGCRGSCLTHLLGDETLQSGRPFCISFTFFFAYILLPRSYDLGETWADWGCPHPRTLGAHPWPLPLMLGARASGAAILLSPPGFGHAPLPDAQRAPVQPPGACPSAGQPACRPAGAERQTSVGHAQDAGHGN